MISASCVLGATTDANTLRNTSPTESPPYTNANGETSIYCSGWNGARMERPIIKFDLTNIPNNANIITADIYFFIQVLTVAQRVYGRRIITTCSPFWSTWRTRLQSGEIWDSLGCDGAADIASTNIFNSSVSKTGSAGWVHYPLDLTEFALLRNNNNGLWFADIDSGQVQITKSGGANDPYINLTYTLRNRGGVSYISDYGVL